MDYQLNNCDNFSLSGGSSNNAYYHQFNQFSTGYSNDNVDEDMAGGMEEEGEVKEEEEEYDWAIYI